MLLDHVRETFFVHHQVADPMVIAETSPGLFFTRLSSHLCAPVFVLLAGVSAFLYGNRAAGDARAAASAFLLKRGAFLVLLEITVINFAWTFAFPPTRVFLQVIWVIGLSMIALAGLLWLPRRVLIAVGIALAAGHALLDGLHFPAGHAMHVPWAVLHDRGWIQVSEALGVRTSYPLLPWIGVIALGYAAGPWFSPGADAVGRQRRLLAWGVGLLAGFVLLRAVDAYGDKPWAAGDTVLATAMSFVNLTKYPPSPLFIALTLGVGLLVLRAFDRRPDAVSLRPLTVFGGAAMAFYVLHLYVLKVLYLGARAIWGDNQGASFGFDTVWSLWSRTAVLAVVLYPPIRAFAAFKARRRDLAWLKYL